MVNEPHITITSVQKPLDQLAEDQKAEVIRIAVEIVKAQGDERLAGAFETTCNKLAAAWIAHPEATPDMLVSLMDSVDLAPRTIATRIVSPTITARKATSIKELAGGGFAKTVTATRAIASKPIQDPIATLVVSEMQPEPEALQKAKDDLESMSFEDRDIINQAVERKAASMVPNRKQVISRVMAKERVLAAIMGDSDVLQAVLNYVPDRAVGPWPR